MATFWAKVALRSLGVGYGVTSLSSSVPPWAIRKESTWFMGPKKPPSSRASINCRNRELTVSQKGSTTALPSSRQGWVEKKDRQANGRSEYIRQSVAERKRHRFCRSSSRSSSGGSCPWRHRRANILVVTGRCDAAGDDWIAAASRSRPGFSQTARRLRIRRPSKVVMATSWVQQTQQPRRQATARSLENAS